MGSRLTIRTPADYRFSRDVCSYGYFLLAPDRWDPSAQTMTTTLELPEGPATVVLAQGPGATVAAKFDRAVLRGEQPSARAQIARMLRLDETEAEIAGFHKADRRWKKSGRGRMYRSPTLFQDMVRTVTSCNVTWPGTVSMNERLCSVLGRGGAFPHAVRLARTRPGTLRGRCRVGYRDTRLIELAGMFVRGEIDESWLTDPGVADADVYKFLLGLPGIGPYAAGNTMMLLGRYSMLAIDTESVRHGRDTLGLPGEDAEIIRALRLHYDRFGAHKFRSYWFEMWTDYEGRKGPAWEWEPKLTATAFTAAKLRKRVK